MNRKGFTLIELLVVIAIIALLLSIMVPSLGKARESARKVICQTNLKQINLGTQLYASNNKNRLPSATYQEDANPGWNPTGTTTWFDDGNSGTSYGGKGYEGIGAYVDLSLEYNPQQHNLMPRDGSVLRCPSVREKSIHDVFPSGICYGMNFEFTTTRLSDIRSPSQKLLFADASWYFFVFDRIQESWIALPSTATCMWDKVRDTSIPSPFANPSSNFSNKVLVLPGRHGKTAGIQDGASIDGSLNVLYVDGHIDTLKRKDLELDAVTGEEGVGTRDKMGTRMVDNGIKNG